MWYLLVAAGAGYLAQRWQNTHKSRPLSCGQRQNQSPSAPSSASAIPKISSFSLSGMKELEDNADTTSDGSVNKEDTSVDCKASLSCFVSGNAEDNIPYQPLSKPTTDSPQCNSLYPQVLKSNKRSACEAFLVPVPDTFKLFQGDKKDQITPNPGLNNIKENTHDQFESSSRLVAEPASIEWKLKGQSVCSLKPSLGSTNIREYAKDQAVSTFEHNPDFVNIDNNEEQLQVDSTSPSSCCSSSSTVLNSPTGRQPFSHKLEAFQFQAKEQRREISVCEQLSISQNHIAGNSVASFLENDGLKGRGQGVSFSVSKYNCSQENYPEALQSRSPGNCLFGAPRSNVNAVTPFNAPAFADDSEMLAASTDRPYVFTGKNQRGITRTEHFSNEFMCNEDVKLDMKQGSLSIAGGTNIPRKVSTESACEAESESLVSFGLAMAVFFMVSSGKNEMEKMGKVLKETEDLVSDMRKELEERRAQSCVSSLMLSDNGSNEKLVTIKLNDPVAQVGKTDTLCQVGCSDDESIRSVVTEEHAQYGLHIHDLNARHEAKLQLVENDIEVSVDGGQQNEEYDSEDEKDSSTREESKEDDYVLSLLELERKLWKVFQERQEEKILELEASLEMALSKLQEKDEELQWWRNRAAWLMEDSIGSTSGSISVENRSERVGEGFNHTNTSSFLIKACNTGTKISRALSACDMNTGELSACEMNFSALEEECIEIVGNADCPKNRSEHQNQMVRVGSDCSISSSEESVLSLDVRTFTYPGYMGSIERS